MLLLTGSCPAVPPSTSHHSFPFGTRHPANNIRAKCWKLKSFSTAWRQQNIVRRWEPSAACAAQEKHPLPSHTPWGCAWRIKCLMCHGSTGAKCQIVSYLTFERKPILKKWMDFSSSFSHSWHFSTCCPVFSPLLFCFFPHFAIDKEIRINNKKRKLVFSVQIKKSILHHYFVPKRLLSFVWSSY